MNHENLGKILLWWILFLQVSGCHDDDVCKVGHFVDGYFDKVFVINLDSRPDRYENITNMLEKASVNNFERFSAVKPDLKDERLLDLDFGYAVERSPNYLIGAAGCLFSHIGVVSEAKERNYDLVLVLEDDAVIHSDINKHLEKFYLEGQFDLIPLWEMLYFSVNHAKPPQVISKNLKRIVQGHTTHAYAIRRNIFDLVLDPEIGAFSLGHEIDLFYLSEIHSRNRSYVFFPNLIGQAPGYSDIQERNVDYGHLRLFDNKK